MRAVLTFSLISVLACGGGSGSASDASPPDAETADASVPDAALPIASDYNGLWIIESITLDDEGVPETFTRDGVASSFRGDVQFASQSDTTALLDVRQAFLEDGLLPEPPVALVASLVIEGPIWIITNPDDSVTVFSSDLEGDELTLALVPGDPRITETDPPIEIILSRSQPWTTTSVGNWDLVSMQLPDGPMVAGACTEVETGLTWSTVDMQISFGDRLLFERVMTVNLYSDALCNVLSETQLSTQYGMAEETGGNDLSIWAVEDAESEYLRFSLVQSGDEITLTRVSCLPAPDCEAKSPTEVVVQSSD